MGFPTLVKAGVTCAAGALQLWGRPQHQRGFACLTKLLCVLLHERLELILQVRQMTGRRAYCPSHCASVAVIHKENRWLSWDWKENMWRSWLLARVWCNTSAAKAPVLYILWPLDSAGNCLSFVKAERSEFLPSTEISVSWTQSRGCQCLLPKLSVHSLEFLLTTSLKKTVIKNLYNWSSNSEFLV